MELNNIRNAELHNVAAGSRREVRPLYTNSNMDTDRFSLRKGAIIRGYVQVMPLDDILSSLNRVDFMKVDVEGFEYDVLLGAEDILKATGYLMIEVFRNNLAGVLNLLKRKGFKVLDMVKYDGEHPRYNILFRNTKIV